MCSNVAPRVSRTGVRDLLNLIRTKMLDEEYATSKVGISCGEVFEGLNEGDVRSPVVRAYGPAKDAAIDSLALTRNSGVALRAKGRSIDYFVFRHHTDILLKRSSVLEKRSEQLFGLTLWADVKTTDDNSELEEERGTVSGLLTAA